MNDAVDKLSRADQLKRISNVMTHARAFATVARLRYDQGNDAAGEFARRKALKFYYEARRLIIQIADDDRQSDSDELQKLKSSTLLLESKVSDSVNHMARLDDSWLKRTWHKVLSRVRVPETKQPSLILITIDKTCAQPGAQPKRSRYSPASGCRAGASFVLGG